MEVKSEFRIKMWSPDKSVVTKHTLRIVITIINHHYWNAAIIIIIIISINLLLLIISIIAVTKVSTKEIVTELNI
jgi:hypothetical protein